MQAPAFFLLRTPLLSIERTLSLLRSDELAAFMQDELVGEALALASPSFYQQFQLDPALTNDKLRETALKYALRMGTRCTPFGLFAGCTVGQSAQATAINFSDRQVKRHYRLDMQVLSALTHYLSEQPIWRNQLRYWPNSGLYRVGSQMRYTEVIQDGLTTRHFISQLDATPSVQRVLDIARDGLTITGLADRLTPPGHDTSEAQAFIEHLIHDQVLVSELSPHVTGPDLLDSLINRLETLSGREALLASLRQVRFLLRQTADIHVQSDTIRNILERQIGVSLPFEDILQCDSFFAGKVNQLGSATLRVLSQTLTKLLGLSRMSPPLSDLEAFKGQFYARFEEREVPLALALDAETGVGYGADHNLTGDDSLVEGLIPSPKRTESAFPSQQIGSLMLQLYSDWLDQGTEHLELTDQDLEKLSSETIAVPESYYALGYFLASSAAAVDNGHYRFVLKGLGGASAFALMTRFCHNDDQLANLVTTQLDQLQKNDAERIYAEVAHLPSPRAGNVLQRPHLHQYEIPYLSHSTLPIDQQIPLADLLVSVPQGKRIVLRSKRLGKEVLARLTTAHNHHTGLPLYRFLGDLQHQDGPLAVNWQWGPLANMRRLPRVQYRQIILQEARWRLEAADWSATLSDDENVRHWQVRWQIPDLVAVAQADHELFLDLTTPVCRQLLVSTVRRLKTLALIEWLRTPDNCWITGTDGKLTHEVVLPFINPLNEHPSLSFAAESELVLTQRSFLPGSEWLYLKVYCGHQTVTSLLQTLGVVAQRSMRKELVTHWYFIRYEDPQIHLRIRFRLTDPAHTAILLSMCQQSIKPFSDTDDVHRVQVDTYQREVERYSSALMESTERLFWADSQAVFRIHQKRPTNDSLFWTAILGMDAYLADFGYSAIERSQVCQQGFTALFDEYGAGAGLRAALAQKYRRNEATVLRLLNGEALSTEERRWQRLVRQRSQRSESHRALVAASSERPANYVMNLLHLFVNRLFCHHPRTYELLLYHHLARAYSSRLARQK